MPTRLHSAASATADESENVYTISSMSIEVRLAKHEELPRAVGLIAALLPELDEAAGEIETAESSALMARMIAEGANHLVFVAIADGAEIVAAATVAQSFALFGGGAYGIINEMVVDRDWRRRGIGGAMVAEIADEATRRGWASVDVTTAESDEGNLGRLFYEGQGFGPVGPKLQLRT
jgi:predicted GNAT family acetyltransferase